MSDIRLRKIHWETDGHYAHMYCRICCVWGVNNGFEYKSRFICEKCSKSKLTLDKFIYLTNKYATIVQ
jgi:hypothetical protein